MTYTNTTHVLQNKRDNEFTISKNPNALSIYFPFRQCLWLVNINDLPNVLDKLTFNLPKKTTQLQNYEKINSNVENRNRCKRL